MTSTLTLENCKDFWSEFNLLDLQKQLDEYVTDITKRQDEAEIGRKKLIEMSKEFKKSTSDETRKTVSPLMKAFQGEIDNLTKRSKLAESYFLNIYKKLSDAPDPTPVLCQALMSKQKLATMTDLEIEKRQLRETLEQYNIEFANYRSQEKDLASLRIKLEECQSNIVKDVEAKVAEAKESILKDYQLKEECLSETNIELTKKTNEQGNIILKLQRSLEATESELFESKAKFEEELQLKNSELELYLSDIEIVNQKLNQSGRVIENFQQSASQEQTNSAISEIEMKNKLLNVELKTKDNEIFRLVEESHHLQSDIAQKDSMYRKKISEQQERLTALAEEYARVMSQLNLHADYDEIKKELSILKVVEFGENYEENTNKSLELLLLDKNRVMQAENSNLRLEVHNYHKKVLMLESELTETKKEHGHQALLIKQLEQDLTQLQAHRIREDADGEPSQRVALVTENVSKEESMDMLAIVTSQRERFKAKNQMLEMDFQQLKTSYAVLQQDNATLRNDNMKLYERIKFLQAMSSGSIAAEDEVTSKYSTQYEAHIDPFSAFNRRERHRKYVNLNSAERVILNLGKMVLSDKIARHAIFFYTLALHLLVFLVLYKFAVSEDCLQLSDCNERFESHMREHHGPG